MKIYISGKITGLDLDIARMRFNAAEKRIKQLGHIPINPMKEVRYYENKKWNDYMIQAIILLLDADGIFMIDNWRDSKGARIEHSIAIETSKGVFYQ